MSKIKTALATFIEAHPAAATLIIAAITFAALAATFYFVVFSGISQSADFIYAHF